MQVVALSEARENLDSLIEATLRDREPITILGNDQHAAVLISAEDYSSMEETLYLLSTPANAAKMRKGLADYAAGNLQPGELCD